MNAMTMTIMNERYSFADQCIGQGSTRETETSERYIIKRIIVRNWLTQWRGLTRQSGVHRAGRQEGQAGPPGYELKLLALGGTSSWKPLICSCSLLTDQIRPTQIIQDDLSYLKSTGYGFLITCTKHLLYSNTQISVGVTGYCN